MTTRFHNTELGGAWAAQLGMAGTADDLVVARLRADVAVRVVPLICDVAEDVEERTIVVADIAACWLALSDEVRDRYLARTNAVREGLFDFCWDYVDRVDGEVAGRYPQLHGPAYESVNLQHWRDHIATVGRRLRDGVPPPERWLRQFPSVRDTALADQALSGRPADAAQRG